MISPSAKIKILLAASRTMTAIQNVRDLITNAIQITTEFCGAERGFLVFDLQDHGMAIADVHGQWFASPELKLSNSMVRKVLSGADPIVWMVTEEGKEIGISDSIMALNLKTVMCAPIKCRNRLISRLDDLKNERFITTQLNTVTPIAALYVDASSSLYSFSQEDLRFFGMFADHVSLAIENALLWEKLRQEHDSLQSRVAAKYHYQNIIGESQKIKEVYKNLELVKDTDIEVLIVGETGTGKELIAKTLHFNGRRANKIFSQVNCAALPESIFEAELFGIERAVATGVSARKGKFEDSNGGTIFLDEIADMPLLAQLKILRFLQDHKFRRVGGREELEADVRIIAATNKDLEREIRLGAFRADLMYRLNTIVITLPPLRERGDDVLLIAYEYLKQTCERYGLGVRGFAADAEVAMLQYPWPGNVRELIHVIQRTAVLTREPVIRADDLHLADKKFPVIKEGSFKYMRNSLEKKLIEQELAVNRYNISAVARNLGVTRKTLYEKIDRLKISWEG